MQAELQGDVAQGGHQETLISSEDWSHPSPDTGPLDKRDIRQLAVGGVMQYQASHS